MICDASVAQWTTFQILTAQIGTWGELTPKTNAPNTNISHHNLKFKLTTASAYLFETRAEPKDLYYSAHVQCATIFFLFINLPICRFIYLRLLSFSNTNLWIVKKWRVLNCSKTFLIVHLHFDTNNNVFWYSNSPYHVAFAYLTGKKWIIVSNHLLN